MTTSAPLRTSAMIASFADPGVRTTPAPFGHALVEAAEKDERIVGLTADLGKYTDMHIFAKAFPERYFQMGMAEQLLFGAAAGRAETGLVPFASTYSVFAARRAYDFICLDIAEPGLNVNIVGGTAGADHWIRAFASSHRGRRDLPRRARADDCRSVRLGRYHTGRASAGRTRRSDPSAPLARPGTHRARRVRLHLRARQGQSRAGRHRCGVRVEWIDDDACPVGR